MRTEPLPPGSGMLYQSTHRERLGKDNLVTQESVPPASTLSLAVTAPESQ